MITSIISLIVGIIFLVVANNISTIIDNITPQVNHGIIVCNRTLGRLGSLIFRDRAQQCEQVTQEDSYTYSVCKCSNIAFNTAGCFCTAYGAITLVAMEIVRRRQLANNS